MSKSENKTILIVAANFPPCNLAGVHRVRHLAKYLPDFGWRPIIMTVMDKYYGTQRDDTLVKWLPAELEFIRVRALPEKLTKFVGVGDISLRSLPFMWHEIKQLQKTRAIDAVIISGGPFYTMMLTPLIKNRFRVPVLLDFQDPWVSNWGSVQAIYTKAGLSHSVAKILERFILKYANFITAVSPEQNTQMRRLYPWLDPKRMAAIPIGGDPDDFRHDQVCKEPRLLDRKEIVISYVGAFWERAAPIFSAVIDGIQKFKARRPDLAKLIQINFVGTGTGAQGNIAPLLKSHGLGDVISEYPERVPYTRVANILLESDYLMLIGSDEPHYTASKIYPSLLSGKPYIAIYHTASTAFDILTRYDGGFVIGFRSGGDLDHISDRVSEHLVQIAEKTGVVWQPDNTVLQPYTAKSVANQYANILDEISSVLPRNR